MLLSFQEYPFTAEYTYVSSMHWVVLFLSIIIGVIIIYQLFNITYGKKKNKRSKYRYLILAILFLLYNLLNGLLPSDNFPTSEMVQYIITYSISIITCIYLVWYLYIEFNIKTPSTFFKIKNLTLILVSCFILLFVAPYYFTKSLSFARSLFLVFPTILSIIFMVYFFKVINKKTKRQRYFKIQTHLGLCSIFSLVLLPALTYFGDFQPITHSIVTSSFFFVTVMEINSYQYRLKNTYKLNQDIAKLYDLTNRENEIVLQIIKGDSYKKIAENMFISYGTVRKHASNIFSKSNCSSRQELIDKVN
jgi:DNA-binding CsgD family transcriptional regulator